MLPHPREQWQEEAEYVLASYEDQPQVRRGMLLVLGRVALEYGQRAKNAQSKLTISEREMLALKIREARLLAQRILQWLASEEVCSTSCEEARTLLERLKPDSQ